MKDKLFNLFESTGDLSVEGIIMNVLAAAVIGAFIYLSYYLSHKGTIYSKKFNASLVVLTVLTGTVMTVIGNNIALSLGMVGALSIVRFRTAVKDPMDLVFMFWSIVAGIICGVGLAEIAILMSLILTVGIVVLDKLPVAKAPMILVVNASDVDAEKRIMDAVARYAKYSTVKSRNMTGNTLDLIVELRTAAGSELLKDILQEEGITSASLLSHDGEVTF